MKRAEGKSEIKTVAALARHLGCHPSAIYRLLKDAKRPPFVPALSKKT